MSLQTIVTNSPLTQDEKDFLLQRLELEGSTPEVIAAIKEALQEYIDTGFKSLGVTLDPNDPQVQATQQKFQEEVAAAEAEYNEQMENIAIDAAVLQARANKSIDGVQADLVKASIAA